MIKVCHMTSAHKRYDQRILYRECVSLQKEGYAVTLLVNDKEEDEKFKDVIIKSTKKDYCGKRLKRMLFGTKNIYKLALKENADIYHIHDPELLPYAIRLKHMIGKIVIFDSHEDYYDRIQHKGYIPRPFRNLIAKIYYSFENRILKTVDGVIFPALKNGKNIFEGRARNIAIVNNVPSLDELPKKSIVDYDLREGICYAGGLTYERGIWHLMKAAYEANVPLYLAGPFTSISFKNEILKYNENNIIRYLGMLNRKEIYQLYGKCLIGMSTLLNIGQYGESDNLPTKVYEYMSMGLPVILSDFSYNRRMIEKYKFGLLVDPENIDDIAEKIRYLVTNKTQAKQMGENGKKLIYRYWNWEIESRNLFELYEKILKNNN